MSDPQNNLERIQFLENKVEQLQQQLNENQGFVDLGKNISYVVHDIRNPLATIGGANFVLVQLIKNLSRNKNLDDSQEILNEININSNRIEQALTRIYRLIANLNQQVKSEDELLVDCSLNQVIDDALDMTLCSFRVRQDWNESVEINTDYDSYLPLIKLHRLDFERAICNLIDNSLHSLKEKKQENSDFVPKLSITTKQLDGRVQLIIEDNGEGIKPEDESKVFKEFYTTKGDQGTGIGLFMVKQTIEEQHNGILALETSYGDFARFIITL